MNSYTWPTAHTILWCNSVDNKIFSCLWLCMRLYSLQSESWIFIRLYDNTIILYIQKYIRVAIKIKNYGKNMIRIIGIPPNASTNKVEFLFDQKFIWFKLPHILLSFVLKCYYIMHNTNNQNPLGLTIV